MKKTSMATPFTNPRDGILYFRREVPEKLRAAFDGKREVKVSLGTRDPLAAKAAFARENAKFEERLAEARRLVAEGKAGATVALDPGGFWLGWERTALKSSLTTSLWTVRCIKSALPMLAERAVSRSLMLALLSARPWSLDPKLVASELAAFADVTTLDALIHDLAFGRSQIGPASRGSGPVTIGGGATTNCAIPPRLREPWQPFPGHDCTGSKIAAISLCGMSPPRLRL